jgi:hypothetical protein
VTGFTGRENGRARPSRRTPVNEFQVDAGSLTIHAVRFFAVEQMLVPSRQTRDPAPGQIIAFKTGELRQRLQIHHGQAMIVDGDKPFFPH